MNLEPCLRGYIEDTPIAIAAPADGNMPVLALQLATGGSEADFGRLRFSLEAGYPVNQPLARLLLDLLRPFRQFKRSSKPRPSADERVCFVSPA